MLLVKLRFCTSWNWYASCRLKCLQKVISVSSGRGSYNHSHHRYAIPFCSSNCCIARVHWAGSLDNKFTVFTVRISCTFFHLHFWQKYPPVYSFSRLNCRRIVRVFSLFIPLYRFQRRDSRVQKHQFYRKKMIFIFVCLICFLRFGMSVARIKFVRYGAITTKIRRELYLWWIQMIKRELTRVPARNKVVYTLLFFRYKVVMFNF